MLHNALKLLREKSPLIHCITNPISIHDCANVVLAVGAKPMMAQHPLEVEEITGTAGALLLNLGNITDTRMKSAILSAKTASRLGIPIVLDAVGVACSSLRNNFAHELMDCAKISLIKGNFTELCALFSNERGTGIDVSSNHKITSENINQHAKILMEYSGSCNTQLLSTGLTDIIASQSGATLVKGGVDCLGKITGTGCMVGALCASFMSVLNPHDSSVLACCYFGVAGEMADNTKGLGTFASTLHDALSMMDMIKLNQSINNTIKLEKANEI